MLGTELKKNMLKENCLISITQIAALQTRAKISMARQLLKRFFFTSPDVAPVIDCVWREAGVKLASVYVIRQERLYDELLSTTLIASTHRSSNLSPSRLPGLAKSPKK